MCIVNRVGQVLVAGGLCKINPDGNVEYYGLLILALVWKRSDDAIELKILECDFAGFDYHTNRTMEPTRLAAVTPNQMLRAVA